jgi:hypothetical protein
VNVQPGSSSNDLSTQMRLSVRGHSGTLAQPLFLSPDSATSQRTTSLPATL